MNADVNDSVGDLRHEVERALSSPSSSSSSSGIPFTHSSNLIYALREAAERLCMNGVQDRIAEISAWLRGEMERMGFDILAPAEHSSPAVLTVVVPDGARSVDVGDRLEQAGYLLSYMSCYLRERNWIQICLMGECSKESIAPMLETLQACCREGEEVS